MKRFILLTLLALQFAVLTGGCAKSGAVKPDSGGGEAAESAAPSTPASPTPAKNSKEEIAEKLRAIISEGGGSLNLLGSGSPNLLGGGSAPTGDEGLSGLTGLGVVEAKKEPGLRQEERPQASKSDESRPRSEEVDAAQALDEPEAFARFKIDERARQEAEARARLEAEARARLEAEMRARQESVEKAGQAEVNREAEQSRRQAEEARDKAAEHYRLQQAESAGQKEEESGAGMARSESERRREQLRRFQEQLAGVASTNTLPEQLKVAQELVERQDLANPELASTFNNLAGALRQAGHYAEAEGCYRLALQVVEAAIQRDSKAQKVPDFQLELDEKGFEHQEASRKYVAVAPELKTSQRIEERKLPPPPDLLSKYKVAEGALRNNLGVLFRFWGRFGEADQEYQAAWQITREHRGEQSVEAAVLRNNIGMLYDALDRATDAEAAYLQAMKILRGKDGGQDARIAAVANNLAGLYLETGKTEPAQALLLESLAKATGVYGPLSARTGLRHYNLGWLYHLQGKNEQAERELGTALAIATESREPALDWAVQSAYARVLASRGERSAAIFFAKRAVNQIQLLRRQVSASGEENARVFRSTVEGVFRQLAGLLVEEGRLTEAERVLEMLKDQEYASFVQRKGGADGDQHASLTPFEAATGKQLDGSSDALATVYARRSALRAKKGKSRDEEQELRSLGQKLDEASRNFNHALNRVSASFGEVRSKDAEEAREAVGLQADLADLGPGTVAVYTIADRDELTLLLITPGYRRAYTVKIGSASLAEKVFAFRSLLQPGPGGRLRDPLPMARELYDIVVKPLQPELSGYGAATILWHLDGPLRYLPLAALNDGSQYLVARYRTVIYSSASKARLKDIPKEHGHLLGLGLSRQHNVMGHSFNALPAVKAEIDGIVRTDVAPGGAIPGEIFLDEAFTWELLRTQLEEKGKYPLIHIASHFYLDSGDDTHSFLVLGDGSPLTLRQVDEQDNLFGGVDLLTLSACETGVDAGRSRDGREVDGLSRIVQQQGAKAVISSLWPVADESTARLMQAFYRLLANGTPKAEALRQAQLAVMVSGPATGEEPQPASGSDRSEVRVQRAGQGARGSRYQADPDHPFAHPYFWAPFMLMGNWK